MQVLLLAAGMGKRLREYTQDNTKCMVRVNGKRIIDLIFDSVKIANQGQKKIDRFIVVTGYKGENLRKYIEENLSDPDVKIEFVDNPDYDTTNNIYSLWLARKYLIEDETILLESDIVYDKNLLKELMADERPNLAVVDAVQPFHGRNNDPGG